MSGKPEGMRFLADQYDRFARQWIDSLTLKPLTEAVGKMEVDPQGCTVTTDLSAPEILVLTVE
jgi:hypothetical protein